MANFNIQEDFIDYWDEVIRQWLSLNANVTGFTGPATEQSNVIKAINENCNYDKNYIINTIHMPEPYWGNPSECSIVLLDYNPAGGARINRHTTINCKECNGFCGEDNKMTVIRYVNEKQKYSVLALKCPVLKENDDLKWFSDKDNGYEGYNWWQEKLKWLNHLVNTICGSNADEFLPFGIELCGWHSKKWSNNMKWIDKEEIKDCIKKRAIQPLFAAMKNSLGDVKIAVCIGAEFKPKLLRKFFDSDTFKDVTKEIFKDDTKEIKLSEQDLGKKENPYETYKDLYYILKNEEENIHVIAKWTETKKNGKTDYKETNRNYRIYKITEDINNEKKNYYILNTHYSGSNSHPGEHFWPFEDVLIGKIKEYDSGIAYNNPSKHPTSHQVERVK